MTLENRDVVAVEDFSRDDIEGVMTLALRCRELLDRGERCEVLRGKLLASLFFEPSTRTRLSFESAFHRLGGRVESAVGMQFSSMAKGETLEDTIRVIDGYADALVLRHPTQGSAARAAAVSRHPLVNAGDGAGEHPTQALLDLFTLRDERGQIENTKVALVGDLKYGRTVHSLAKVLAHFEGVELLLVSPEQLKLPRAIEEQVRGRGVRVTHCRNLADAVERADVLYVTRLQAERFEDPSEAARLIGSYVVNRHLLERCNRSQDITIMHPLPRLHDLAPDVDDLPGAAFFRQAHNGVPVRMALFCSIFGVSP